MSGHIDTFVKQKFGLMRGLEEVANRHENSESRKGVKYDNGKNRLGLVLGGFSEAIQDVGQVGTFGAKKYTDNGWCEVGNGEERYMDAALRHLFKYLSGEVNDQESHYPHLAHAAWNVLAVHQLNILKTKEK